jgi:hypothetical protein
MIEAMPSITKNTMRIKVSERTPLNGHNSSMIPTAIPRIAGELPAEYPQGAGAAGVTVLNQGVLLNPLRDGSPESAVQPYAAIAPTQDA